MKRILIVISVFAVLISLGFGGTWAYFTAKRNTRNVVTTGNIKLKILEWKDEAMTVPFRTEDRPVVVPGSKSGKVVQAENTGSHDAWVRFRLNRKIRLRSGVMAEDASSVRLVLNHEDWIAGEDGFCYYKRVLRPGERTEPVMTGIALDQQMTNEFAESQIIVDVKLYGVQSVNNGTDVMSAAGWPTN